MLLNVNRLLLAFAIVAALSSTTGLVRADQGPAAKSKETLLYLRLAVDPPSRAVEQTLIEELRLASERHTAINTASPPDLDAFLTGDPKELLASLRRIGIEQNADAVAAVAIYDGLPTTVYLVVIEQSRAVGRIDELSPSEREAPLIALAMRELIEEVALFNQDLGSRPKIEGNRSQWMDLPGQMPSNPGSIAAPHPPNSHPRFSIVPLLRMNASVGQNHGIEEWLGGSLYGLRLVHPRLGIKLGATYLHSLDAFNNTEGISGWRLMGSLGLDYAFFHVQGARLSAILETSAILSRMNARVTGYDPVGVYRGNGKVSLGLSAQFKLSSGFGLYFGAAIGSLFTRRSFELTGEDRQIYLNSYLESDLFLGGTFDLGTRQF